MHLVNNKLNFINNELIFNLNIFSSVKLFNFIALVKLTVYWMEAVETYKSN